MPPERRPLQRREQVRPERRLELENARRRVLESLPEEQRRELSSAWEESGFERGFVPVRLLTEAQGTDSAPRFLFNSFQASSKAFSQIENAAKRARSDNAYSNRMARWLKSSPKNAKNWALKILSPSYWLPVEGSVWVNYTSRLADVMLGTFGWIFTPRSRFKKSRIGKWHTENQISRATRKWSSESRHLLEEYEKNPEIGIEELKKRKSELDAEILKAYGIKEPKKMAGIVNAGRDYAFGRREVSREFQETGEESQGDGREADGQEEGEGGEEQRRAA